jgi:hypothetical protein
MAHVEIVKDYIPGSIGRVAELHGIYYSEHWRFGLSFEGLGAARHLYEKRGFRLVEQRRGKQWGTEVNEQRFLLQLQ